MVKHLIIWKLKENYTEEESKKAVAEIKAGLESLAGKIPGMIDITVHDCPLPTSNREAMLEANFVDFESLQGYVTNPEHVAIAKGIVKPHVEIRSCFDYEL